jgi:hypothetical protein
VHYLDPQPCGLSGDFSPKTPSSLPFAFCLLPFAFCLLPFIFPFLSFPFLSFPFFLISERQRAAVEGMLLVMVLLQEAQEAQSRERSRRAEAVMLVEGAIGRE